MFLASSVPALGGWDALLRLVVAAGLGAAIGAEREVREREAGIRTHLLVSLTGRAWSTSRTSATGAW